MARIYLDEDVNQKIVSILEKRGHDVQTTEQAGKKGSKDAEQMDHAISTDRVLVTNNRGDFVKEHRLRADHPGIISGKGNQRDFQDFANRVDVVLSSVDAKNKHVSADKGGYKVEAKSGEISQHQYVKETDSKLNEAKQASSGDKPNLQIDAAYFAQSVDDSENFPPKDDTMAELVDYRRAFEGVESEIRVSCGGPAELTGTDKDAQMQDRADFYISHQQQMSLGHSTAY